MNKNISLGVEQDTLRDLLLGRTATVTATSNGVTYRMRAVPGKTLNKAAPDVLGALVGVFPSLPTDVLAPLATLLEQLLGTEGSEVLVDELAKSASEREAWLEKSMAATDHDLRVGYARLAAGR